MEQQNVEDNSKINFSYDKYTDRMHNSVRNTHDGNRIMTM